MKGDVTLILETIMVSRNEDVERYLKKYEELIEAGTIQRYKKYDQTKKKIKMLKNSEEEEKELAQTIRALQSQIAVREQMSNSFLAALEAKYGGDKKKKLNKKKPAFEENEESKPAKKKK